MFGSLFKYTGAESAKKEQEEFLGLLRVGTDSEMAEALAAAGMARQILWQGQLINARFPEEFFTGAAEITNGAREEIATYLIKLCSMRDKLAKSPDRNHQFIASGFSIYIATFRALTRPELFALGRQIWAELLRGCSGYQIVMTAIRPDLAHEDLQAVSPIPNALIANEALK